MTSSPTSARSGLRRAQATRLVSLLLGLSACGGGGDGGIITRVPTCTITGVTVQPSATTLSVGESTLLQALPSSQNCTSIPAVTWTSAAPSVATVGASTGQVTAVTPGTAVITASIGSASGSAVVTVPPPPVASIAVTPSAPSALQVGQSVTLTAEPRDAQGRALTGRVVTWQSSAASIATVSSAGVVTAAAPGTATITATSEGISSSPVTITVQAQVASILLTVPTTTLVVPQSTQATAVVRNAQGGALAGETVTWSSTNLGVATVSATGLITAVGAGQTTVRATSVSTPGVSASTVVTVASGGPCCVVITLAATLNLTEFATATAVVRDAAQNVIPGANVTWTSSNPAVANVISTTGVVTALSAGNTNITATVVGTPAATATKALTVVAPVRTVSLVQSNVLLEPGPNAGLTSVQLNVTLRDALGNVLTGRTITYTSSNTAAATVNASGLVSAVGVGTGTITVTSEGISTSIPLVVARAFAVIEANQPATNSYQPIQFNSAGSPITVTRTGTGQYRVSIAGIGLAATTIGRNFTALVSGANAGSNAQLLSPTVMCNMSGLDPAGPTIITVLCNDPITLAFKDAPFRAILIGDNSVGGTGTGAAFSAHTTFTGPTYNAPATFAWNTAGAAMTVTPAFGAPDFNSTQARHSMGITFPGQHALVSTISAAAGVSCEVQSQVPSTQVTDVVCFDRTGAVNALHTLVKLSSGRPGANGGLAFVDAGTGVNTGQGFNSAGGTVVTSRTGVGRYTVVFGGMVATGALGVMVSPWGATGWAACSHFVVSTNPVTIDVACYNAFGAFMNAGSAFTLLVLQ